MNQELLRQFYDNQPMREEVKAFIVATLKERAFKELMNNADATYLAKSIKGVDDVFMSLAEVFAPPKKKIIQSTR